MRRLQLILICTLVLTGGCFSRSNELMPAFIDDDFSGAAGVLSGTAADVGGNWVNNTVFGAGIVLTGSGSVASDGTALRLCLSDTAPGTANYRLKSVINIATGSGDGSAGLMSRASKTAVSWIYARVESVASAGRVAIYSNGSGSPSVTGAVDITASTGVLSTECVGGEIRAYWNGVLACTLTGLTAAPSPGFAGVIAQNERFSFEDFEAELITEFSPSTPATPATPATGLALGDSTVAAHAGGTAIASLVYTAGEISGGLTVDNIAVPGHTIAQQKAAWTNYADKTVPDWIVVQIGLNDVNPATPASTAIAALQDLIDTIDAGKRVDSVLTVSTMVPAYARWGTLFGASQDTAQARWESINEAIRGEGPTPITGVDGRISGHTGAMGDASDNLLAVYDTGDGIHPNTAGRTVNAAWWRQALVAAGEITDTVPTVAAIAIDDATLTITYSESVTGFAGWSLTSDGGAIVATYSSGDGTSAHVYTLDRTPAITETITADYDPGTQHDDTNTALAAITDRAVSIVAHEGTLNATDLAAINAMIISALGNVPSATDIGDHLERPDGPLDRVPKVGDTIRRTNQLDKHVDETISEVP